MSGENSVPTGRIGGPPASGTPAQEGHVSERSGQGFGPRAAAVVIALLLSAHAIVGIDSARRQSITHDEFWHLPIGPPTGPPC